MKIEENEGFLTSFQKLQNNLKMEDKTFYQFLLLNKIPSYSYRNIYEINYLLHVKLLFLITLVD
jgi:hypothetical protein